MYEFVIAVNDEDRYGQDVDLSELDYSRYLKNPVVMLAHGYPHRLPVGLTRTICSGPGGVEVRFYFAKGDETADQVENLVRQGIVRSASIGWYYEKGIPYLAEWSLVAIGLDPDATARSTDPPDDDDEGSSGQRMYITRATLKPLDNQMADDQCTNRTDQQPSTGTEPANSSDANPNPEPARSPAPNPEPAPTGDLAEIQQARADLRNDLASLQQERAQLRLDRLADKYRALLTEGQTYEDEASLLRAACGNQLTEGVEYSIGYMEAMADVALENRSNASDDANNAPIRPRESEGDGERGDFIDIAGIARL